MESWRKVWREGLAPLLSDNSLRALRRALVEDDPRLIQGATTTPPPLPSFGCPWLPPAVSTAARCASSHPSVAPWRPGDRDKAAGGAIHAVACCWSTSSASPLLRRPQGAARPRRSTDRCEPRENCVDCVQATRAHLSCLAKIREELCIKVFAAPMCEL